MPSARCSLLFVCTSLCAQITPESLFSYKEISEIQVSPDGTTVLFVVSAADLKANQTVARLMKLSTRGGAPAPVAGAVEGLSNVRWASESQRFAYTAKDAIWVQGISSDRPAEVCKFDHSNSFLSKAGNVLSWSPDGNHLAFAGTTEPAPAPADPVVINRLQFKTRTAISDNRRTHIYTVPAGGGTPRAITPGNFDEHSIDWGGDGSEIAFLSNREPDPDARLNYDIYAVEVATGRVRRITKTAGVEFDPKLSPDGRFIAYVATTRAITTIDSVAEDTHIWVIPAAGGKARELNAALDRRSVSPMWSVDGEGIYYLAADHGKTLLYKVPSAGGESKPLFDKLVQLTAFSAQSGKPFFIMSGPLHPPEIYSLDGQLTHLNESERPHFSKPQTISYRSFDGTEVEGWLYPALDIRSRAPMILSIHGGPHGQFSYAFNPVFQFNAARGYATLAINPRGSSGYGQRFADGTLNSWGGGDYKDLMAGVDYVLANHPEIDPGRLGVTGASYGGYMTDWMITQTNRFKAAVAVASLSDLISFYGTSLYQDLIHAEFSGYPWEGGNYALLWKWSPLAHVQDVATPTLFLHGEQDNDVHITQAEEMYTALRQRGITSELVRYPREGHGFHEPKHQLDSRVRTLDWMDRYLQNKPAETK